MLGAVIFACYFVFLVALLPVRFILSFAELPEDIKLYGVSGTLWQAKVDKVSVQGQLIEKVEIETKALSLLTFDPKIHIQFGDDLLPGPQGSLILSGLLADITIRDLSIYTNANLIAQVLPAPIPIFAHNSVSLTMDEFVMGAPVCQLANGLAQWDKAKVTALEDSVNLGALSATIGCEKGQLAVTINDDNDLGLSFKTLVGANGSVTGSGFLKPGTEFPEKMKPLLSFLGNPDNRGRYRLVF